MAVKEGITSHEGPPAGDFKGDIKVDDKLPTSKELAKAGEIEVFDREKKGYKFSSLYSNSDGEERKYLVIFIRHFFCGNCQEYIYTLSNALPPSSLPPSTSILIIGCGSPTLIDTYIANTACPYPIYADPSRRLYQILRMTRTLNLGSRSPEYMSHTSVPKLMFRSIWQELKAGRQMLSGGDFSQVGGEFVFSVDDIGKTEVTWCRRMRNTRDHAELPDVKKALGITGGASPSSSLEEIKPIQQAPTPEKKKRWSTITSSNLGRRLSKRTQRTSWHPTNTNGRATNGTALNGSAPKKPSSPGAKETEQERQVLEQLKEEGTTEESNVTGTGTEDAMAKLMGAPKDASTTVKAGQATGAPVENTTHQNGAPIEAKVLLNGSTTESLTNGAPIQPEPTAEKPLANSDADGVTLPESTPYQNGSAAEGVANGTPIEEQTKGPLANGTALGNGQVVAAS